MIAEPYNHRANVPEDDGSPITFKWHFQRGMLRPRMSAYELSEFVLKHMPSIVPLFAEHPRVQREFQAMLTLLATTPKAAIDQLVPWIRSVTKTEEDDIITLSLFEKRPQPSGPTYFV